MAWRILLQWVGASLGFGFLAVAGAIAEPGILRVSLTDADTDDLTACTVSLTDAAGRVWTDGESFAGGIRTDGELERALPPGVYRLRVSRGPETRAEERAVTLVSGERLEVRVRLRRIVDLRRRGWYGGDSHVHMIHGERTIGVTFDDVALAARAEDLQYLSLAQHWSLADATPEALEAELRSRSRPDCVLTWNLEAPKNYYLGDAGRCLGHCWTLGMKGRTADGGNVLDLLLAASAHDYESDKPTFANFESHALIRAQGGAVFYTHPARTTTGPWGGRGGYPRQLQMRVSNMAVELPLDTLIGPTFDGLDLITTSGEWEANARAFDLWCLLLNRGYRLAPTASSDACFDRPGGAVPGVVRTYTHLEGGFSLAAVTRAAAGGRNFVTSGPLLLATLDGQPPGSEFPSDGRGRTLRIEAWASGAATGGLSRIEVLRNGEPFATHPLTEPVGEFEREYSITEKETSWYCVRASGSDPRRERAITGAFYFVTSGHRPPEPVRARIQVRLVDAENGMALGGSVTEVEYRAGTAHVRGRHAVSREGLALELPGTYRLKAEAPGYRERVLSPFLDHPPLIDYVTGLTAEDLLDWSTYERIRNLLQAIPLTFHLDKQVR